MGGWSNRIPTSSKASSAWRSPPPPATAKRSRLLLRDHDPADLAIAGGHVIWRMATALGQMVEPTRSPPQMIHVFAQALRDSADEGGLSG